MLEKLVRLALLYDFYGPLLTDKQQQFIELYYHQDWSLSEIAERFRISRQAVHDLLRRAEAALEEYEGKLHLVERFWERRAAVEDLMGIFAKLDEEFEHWMAGGQPECLRRIRSQLRSGRKLLERLANEI